MRIEDKIRVWAALESLAQTDNESVEKAVEYLKRAAVEITLEAFKNEIQILDADWIYSATISDRQMELLEEFFKKNKEDIYTLAYHSISQISVIKRDLLKIPGMFIRDLYTLRGGRIDNSPIFNDIQMIFNNAIDFTEVGTYIKEGTRFRVLKNGTVAINCTEELISKIKAAAVRDDIEIISNNIHEELGKIIK